MFKMLHRYSASSLKEIERRAKEIFEQCGCQQGNELDHWLLAEADFLHDYPPAHTDPPSDQIQ